MAEDGNIVRVTNVTKTFKLGKIDVKALKGIDLHISKGDYISIMGPSGSGKSTLFNMIGGLDKPTSGKVFIDEVDIAQLDAYELAWLRCRKIGYIFQTFNIIQVMTALENVTLGNFKIDTFEGFHIDLSQFKRFGYICDANDISVFCHGLSLVATLRLAHSAWGIARSA